ncbi:uncharacterized protein C18orf19 homolog A [Callorhinchus milii]|uniref:Family with sequence similarity 210 member Ab n=1 Tax=Callorhinchus milii TaxID=7868 RepID=A0A4W3KHN3_CALMI|nr:uncharacterized protein C18orf19 homolog A [Callorhinchus milii]XP_042187858.1 uncharacterized protein C18orf19 homolog A [Callorhinchus milii]|eukprot:gi/632954909/ref/XP_007893213.1/ PREDICTED: protein FAM210A [Callorhinchus milii]
MKMQRYFFQSVLWNSKRAFSGALTSPAHLLPTTCSSRLLVLSPHRGQLLHASRSLSVSEHRKTNPQKEPRKSRPHEKQSPAAQESPDQPNLFDPTTLSGSGEGQQRLPSDSIQETYYYDTKQEQEAAPVETDPLQDSSISLFQRFKKTFKQYGKVMIPVHLFTSTLWFGTFYYAAMKGVNVVPFFELLGLPDSLLNLLRKSQGGNALTAYALYKIATPARYTVTLGGTSFAVKYLRTHGYMSTPPPVRDYIQDKMDETRERFSEKMEETKEMLSGKMEETKGKISGKMEETKDKISGKIQETKEKVSFRKKK